VRKAAAELDVDIRWEGPTNETEHDRQRSIVDNMVGLGVDGIALAPTDETALVRPVRSAMQRGIPVVIYDSNLNAQQGTDFVSFVATDNEKGGRLAGEHLVERLGDGAGRVVVLRYTEGSGSTLRRERGFLDVMQRAKNIKVLDHQFSDGSTAGALSTATNMLSQFISDNTLQIDGIFASNLATTLGMQRALDRLRKQGVQVRVNFIGFDASQKLIEGVEQGEIEALVVQNPRHMGYLAIETLVKHIRGQPVAPYIDTGVELVTKDRLTEPAIRALLGF
jgi:ribose transport system substrate-binding protein